MGRRSSAQTGRAALLTPMLPAATRRASQLQARERCVTRRWVGLCGAAAPI